MLTGREAVVVVVAVKKAVMVVEAGVAVTANSTEMEAVETSGGSKAPKEQVVEMQFA